MYQVVAIEFVFPEEVSIEILTTITNYDIWFHIFCKYGNEANKSLVYYLSVDEIC